MEDWRDSAAGSALNLHLADPDFSSGTPYVS